MRRSHRKSNDHGHVYAIRHEHGYFKIGESDTPKSRLRTLQTACPYRLYLYTTIEVFGDAEFVEGEIHDDLWGYQKRGEWFDLTDEQAHTLADIDRIHEDVVEKVPNWSVEKHANLGDGERDGLIENVLEEQLSEAVELIENGEFPRENIEPSNGAIDKWATRAEVPTHEFIEALEDEL